MFLSKRALLSGIRKIDGRTFCATVGEIQSFRTDESNPANHDSRHVNKFYTTPPEICKLTCQPHFITTQTEMEMKAFQERAILIREPAVEIISYLNQADYSKPINRYVIYGAQGVGKTTTSLHVLHYGLAKEFIVVHVNWPPSWFKFPKEIANSPSIPGVIDLPIDAGIWLKHFKMQNEDRLSMLDLKTSKEYEWNHRESTTKGETLLELVNFGISRVKYACTVITVLMEELKAASTAGKCRTLVIIDGFNAFLSDHSTIRGDDRIMVPPKNISLTKAFLDTVKNDWCNGAVVLTLDNRAYKENPKSVFPMSILGRAGFEEIDPFVPIEVNNYTNDEFDTVIEYYKDRKWIRELSTSSKNEFELLTSKNPRSLIKFTRSL